MSYRCQRCAEHCNHRAIKVIVERHANGQIASEQELCSPCAAVFGHAIVRDALTTRVRKAGLAVRNSNGHLVPPGAFVSSKTVADVEVV